MGSDDPPPPPLVELRLPLGIAIGWSWVNQLLPPLGVKNVKIQENSEKIRGPPGDP